MAGQVKEVVAGDSGKGLMITPNSLFPKGRSTANKADLEGLESRHSFPNTNYGCCTQGWHSRASGLVYDCEDLVVTTCPSEEQT